MRREGWSTGKSDTISERCRDCPFSPYLTSSELGFSDSMWLPGKPDTGTGPPANKYKKISIFLSAVDDTVLLSCSRTDCNRQLILLLNYCQKAGLKISYPKTQIISIGRQPPAFNWFLFNNLIQQVKSFSYLGVQFATNSSWRVHQEAILPKLDVLGVFYWEFLNGHSGNW